MKTVMYAIYDQKLAEYGNPFPQENDTQAVRSLHVAVNEEKIQLAIFPEDFSLYKVGEFDKNTGKFEAEENPKFIVSAISLKKIQKEEK